MLDIFSIPELILVVAATIILIKALFFAPMKWKAERRRIKSEHHITGMMAMHNPSTDEIRVSLIKRHDDLSARFKVDVEDWLNRKEAEREARRPSEELALAIKNAASWQDRSNSYQNAFQNEKAAHNKVQKELEVAQKFITGQMSASFVGGKIVLVAVQNVDEHDTVTS